MISQVFAARYKESVILSCMSLRSSLNLCKKVLVLSGVSQCAATLMHLGNE